MNVYLVYAKPGVVSAVVANEAACAQHLDALRAENPECFSERTEVMGETAPPEELKPCDDLMNGERHEFVVAITDRFVITSTLNPSPCFRYKISEAIELRRAWIESGRDASAYNKFALKRIMESDTLPLPPARAGNS